MGDNEISMHAKPEVTAFKDAASFHLERIRIPGQD